LTITRARIAYLRRVRRRFVLLRELADESPWSDPIRRDAVAEEYPDLIAVATKLDGGGRALTRGAVALVDEQISDARAQLAKLRDVRMKLKASGRT